MKNSAVFAVLKDRVHAEVGVDTLMNVGFRPEDISVMLADRTGAGAPACGTAGLLAGLETISIPGLNIPEADARGYAGMVREGRTLLSVYCRNSEWVTRAKRALARVGAEKVGATRDSGEDYRSCGVHGGV
ncbi:MAG TPA: hypothetical protein VMH28_02500 [Candidatus Acidoferrales bacterium]|nr:hypothetical protein [Candidatus Acidoferrales bacterium]